MVLIGSSGNAKTESVFILYLKIRLNLRIASFSHSPFGLPSKCKKGNDNYTFVTAYYSNFGELIALMCLPNVPMLLSINDEHIPCILSFIIFQENLMGIHAYHFMAFALCFLSSDRFYFCSVCNLLPLNTDGSSNCFQVQRTMTFFVNIKLKNVVDDFRLVGNLVNCKISPFFRFQEKI